MSVPFGLTAELNFIPETEISDIEFKHTSFALKWTFTNQIPLPFDMALRVHGSSTQFSYSDTINNSSTANRNVDTNIAYETSSFGFNISGSINALVFEPYAGIGYVSTETDIGLSAATSVSIFDFTEAGNYTAENSGAHIFLGANVNLFLMKIGFEGSSIMGVNRYTFKLSAYF